ncbi:MAG TPA: hypothetical protein DCZ95_06205 [Verrucomicrobia bacterium]|nr:MAG: hypothetical protein A2X46_08380 [Lentisphaerae bacterium GWF2_57_35]HBA83671.1 hypothetical protein [Verrucomicrobiota bacterium]
MVIIGVFIAVLLVSPACQAGYEIRCVFKDFVSSRPSQYSAPMRLDGGKINVNTSQFSGEPTELLYAVGSKSIRLVNRASGEYSELNEETLGRAADMVQSTLDYVMGTASDESQGAPSGNPRAPAIAEVKGAWTVNGMTCRRYKAAFGGQLTQDIWVADWAAAGMKSADFKVVNLLAGSYDRIMKSSNMIPSLDFMVYIPVSGLNRMNGFPVLIKQYRKGALQYEILLSRPVFKKMPASLFQVPEGFRKVWF